MNVQMRIITEDNVDELTTLTKTDNVIKLTNISSLLNVARNTNSKLNKQPMQTITSVPVEYKEDEKDDENAGRLASVLFDQAALSAGRQLENPAQFVQELNKLMFQ